MKYLVVLLLSISMTSITGHPVEERRSSEVERSVSRGKEAVIESSGEVTSSKSQSQMVPSPLIRAKLVPRRRRLNSRMMIDPQLSGRESRIVHHHRRFPEPTNDESSASSGTYRTNDERPGTYRTNDERPGTYRTNDERPGTYRTNDERPGTYRTNDERIEEDESMVSQRSRRRRIESVRATPLTRFPSSSSPSSPSPSSGDQSRRRSSSPRDNPSNSPYIFPLSSSSSSPSSNMRRSLNNRRSSGSSEGRRKKVIAGGHVEKKKKELGKKTEIEVNSEEGISSEGVSSNPPQFEQVRDERRNLDMKTIGRLISDPRKSGSLIDLASYRKVSNGQGDPVFYGNDMLFHREPSYENEDDNNSRTRNSLSIDPNTEFVLITK